MLEDRELYLEEKDKYAKWNSRIQGVSSDGVNGNSVSSQNYNGGVYGATSSETYQGNSYLDRDNDNKKKESDSDDESSEEDDDKKKDKSEESSSNSEEEKRKKKKTVKEEKNNKTSKISIKKPTNNNNTPNILDFDFNTDNTNTNQTNTNTNNQTPDFDSIFGAPSSSSQKQQNNQNVFDFISQNNTTVNSFSQQQPNLIDFTSQSIPQQQNVNMFQYQNNFYNNNIYQFPQQNTQKQTTIPDEEFKEVIEPDTKPKQNGLNNLLDTKLVDLDNLNGKGKFQNNSNFNFY